jgi:hypothetical protein
MIFSIYSGFWDSDVPVKISLLRLHSLGITKPATGSDVWFGHITDASEDAESVSPKKSVPQRLKPHWKQDVCGTAKAVPLSKARFSTYSVLIHISPQCHSRTINRGENQCAS